MPDPVETRDPWKSRFEILALVVVVLAAASILGAMLVEWGQLRSFPLASSDQVDPVDVLSAGGFAVDLFLAGLLFLAFLLVAVAPGDGLGRWGQWALRAVMVVASVAGVLAAWAVVETLLGDEDRWTSNMGGDPTVATRLGAALPLAAAAALTLFTAWSAWQALGSWSVAGVGSDADVDADADAPRSPETHPN